MQPINAEATVGQSPYEHKEDDTIQQLKNLGFKWPDSLNPTNDLFLDKIIDLPTGWEKGPEMYSGNSCDQTEFYIQDQQGTPRVLVSGTRRQYCTGSIIEILTEDQQSRAKKKIQYKEACDKLMAARVNAWAKSHSWCVLMIYIPIEEYLCVHYACGGYYSTKKEAIQAATLLGGGGLENFFVRIGQILEDYSKNIELSYELSKFELVSLSNDEWRGECIRPDGLLRKSVSEEMKNGSIQFPAVMVKESKQVIIPRGIDGIDEI